MKVVPEDPKPIAERTPFGRPASTVQHDHGEYRALTTVTTRHRVADDVVTIELSEVNGHPLPSWAPGAHIDVVLEHAPTRQYSLCGVANDLSRYRIGVLRDPNGRGSSRYIHDDLQIGDTVAIRGPRNNFPLIKSPRYLFCAGGIGITPFLPMIADAEAAGSDWRLLYGGRRRSSMAFAAALEAYGDRVSVVPKDEHGLLDLDAYLGTPQTDTLVYCCGPEPLLRAVEQRCSSWPKGSLHVERFAPKAIAEPMVDIGFEVVCARSELTLTVGPDETIFDVVADAGVNVQGSCFEGTCSTCQTRVLAGEPDHRDSVLTDEQQKANDTVLICVSRSRTPRLVLDI